MNFKQILGALIFVGGIVLLFVAHYINTQIEEGNIQIFNAQKKVDQGSSLFNMTPYSKPIGQGLTSGAQKKINEGKGTIAYYTVVAQRCQISGIIAIVIGAGMMFLLRKKRHR